jgi:hypothetical protein
VLQELFDFYPPSVDSQINGVGFGIAEYAIDRVISNHPYQFDPKLNPTVLA